MVTNMLILFILLIEPVKEKPKQIKHKKEYKCLDCHIKITSKAKRCDPCNKINSRKIKNRFTHSYGMRKVD